MPNTPPGCDASLAHGGRGISWTGEYNSLTCDGRNVRPEKRMLGGGGVGLKALCSLLRVVLESSLDKVINVLMFWNLHTALSFAIAENVE